MKQQKQLIKILSLIYDKLETPRISSPTYMVDDTLYFKNDMLSHDEKMQIVQITDEWYHQMQIDERTKLEQDKILFEGQLKKLL